ncbi:hypothetical protein [Paraburkholderia acidipaludis]|uniref:hypothetical protein n=1 Tax=Paraburkholderia acidipaludis TaxID=660537 RepID=UPI0004868909|nr:hypothetical protein [Paraburkholderia acidipaludis]
MFDFLRLWKIGLLETADAEIIIDEFSGGLIVCAQFICCWTHFRGQESIENARWEFGSAICAELFRQEKR